MSNDTFTCESSEIHVKYRIPQFLDLPSHEHYKLESPNFYVSKATWYLLIYPNKLEDTSHHIGLFLGKRNSNNGHHVVFKFTLKGTDGSDIKARKTEHVFTEEEPTFGWPAFVERDSLKSKNILAPDGSLTVFCTVLTGDNMEVISQPIQKDGIQILSENFKDLYIGRSFSDVTVIVQGREFPVHRNVLAARSKVFDSMFNLDMVEKQTGKVEIEDCDPDSFETFLLYVYTGKLDDVLWSLAINIYKIADKYDLPNLKTECVQRLTNTICVESFCDVIQFATMHNETKLLTLAKTFFTDNAKAIILNEKWKIFLVENPLLINDLLVNLVDKYEK